MQSSMLMGVDSEHMYDQLTPANKPETKSFENIDNVVENGRLKANNEIKREDKHGIVSDHKSQNCEMYTDLLPTENHDGDEVGDKPRLNDIMDMEDSINGEENKAGDSFTPCIVSASGIEFNEKETDFFTDKSITEYELSKLILCFKEGSYQVVKDICIDEGMSPTLDKDLLKNDAVNHKTLFSFLQSEMDMKSDLSKEKVDTASPDSNGMKPLVECDCDKSVANRFGSKISMQNGEKKIASGDEIANDIFDEKVVPVNTCLVQELDIENSHPRLTKFDGNEDHQQSDQETSKEDISANSTEQSAAEEFNNINHANFNSKVESGRITFDFNSSTPATSGNEEDPQNANSQQPIQTQNTVGLEDGTVDSRTVSSRSFYVQHGHGESSFSLMGPLSDPVAYSGRVPYSGSISLRSDSSTASTHSFAFPILHSEWNSSPVKMAKANRKHRCWGIGLLCCKF